MNTAIGSSIADTTHQASTEATEFTTDEEAVGGYSVPVDPMDLLQCDSCQ